MDFNVLKTTQNTFNRLLELVERQLLRLHFVFEVGKWLHNKPADIDSGLVNGQRFDSSLPCANSKPILNLSKAVFLKFIRPWLWMAARSKNRAVTCGGSSRLSPRRKSKKPLSRRVCPAVTSGEECGLLC